METKVGRLARAYIKDLVYGANDGIITTFAVVASIEGARLGSFAILAVGFASLVADGLSMAASDYLASRSEQAAASSSTRASEFRESPWFSALVTFASFVLIGAIPLVPYLAVNPEVAGPHPFVLSGIGAAVALFAVGSLRTRVTGRSFVGGGLEMMLIGGGAAAIAYGIGQLVDGLRSGGA